MSADLERFVAAQEGVYGRALEEIRAGCKRTHWMWFVFPQLRGLGRSAQAQHYGITGLDEARRYLAHPLLGPRLEAATRCALDSGEAPLRIFGAADCRKFVSCMTLFAQVAAPGSVFHLALRQFPGGDQATLAMLGRNQGGDNRGD